VRRVELLGAVVLVAVCAAGACGDTDSDPEGSDTGGEGNATGPSDSGGSGDSSEDGGSGGSGNGSSDGGSGASTADGGSGDVTGDGGSGDATGEGGSGDTTSDGGAGGAETGGSEGEGGSPVGGAEPTGGSGGDGPGGSGGAESGGTGGGTGGQSPMACEGTALECTALAEAECDSAPGCVPDPANAECNGVICYACDLSDPGCPPEGIDCWEGCYGDTEQECEEPDGVYSDSCSWDIPCVDAESGPTQCASLGEDDCANQPGCLIEGTLGRNQGTICTDAGPEWLSVCFLPCDCGGGPCVGTEGRPLYCSVRCTGPAQCGDSMTCLTACPNDPDFAGVGYCWSNEGEDDDYSRVFAGFC
jgi:hypothetical protein